MIERIRVLSIEQLSILGEASLVKLASRITT
ncbi:hypothetical protein [Nostoc sp. C117]